MPRQPLDENKFVRLLVDYLVAGKARVVWELNRHFIDPLPYTFQLQASHSEAPTDEDENWIDVGDPVINGFTQEDEIKRLYGKTKVLLYRVVLTTPKGSYISRTEPAVGRLSKFDWLKLREYVRKEQLRHRVLSSIDGYLLKARRDGQRCTECLDTLTDEILNSDCEECKGTGWINGYYAAYETHFADVSGDATREHREIDSRGTVRDVVITGRILGFPPLVQGDVWVNKAADDRYYIHSVKELAVVRGVPAIYEAELRLAPYTDVIYTIPLTGS